ncbi:hypothetical protein ABC195_15840 [Microbacterium sp. 2P01SA-2]|uniref:hypothetical protein n=1 Tax=unclassified Microbacterium TaxID=2609290 RepID=UPI00399F17F5
MTAEKSCVVRVTPTAPFVKDRAPTRADVHDEFHGRSGEVIMITDEEQNEQHTDIRGEKPFGQWLGLINGGR